MADPNYIHEAASSGFDNAVAYDTHRPSYPPQAIQSLLEHVSVVGKAGAKVVDLAAGTGKMTALLAARSEGYETIAIEPLESMRKGLLAKKIPNVVIKDGTAAKMDLESGQVDVVIIAQAFHWFAKNDALIEIHRVLVQDGKLAMIWNVEDYNRPKSWPASTSWEDELNNLVHALSTDNQPRFRDNRWEEVFRNQAANGASYFSTPVETESIPFTVKLSLEALYDRVSTLSHIAVMEGKTKADFRSKFDAILGKADRVGDGDEVEIHGFTFMAWTSKV